MAKKVKLRYLNFNIIQLIDKGKLKLHYRDNIKSSSRKYSLENKKVKTLTK